MTALHQIRYIHKIPRLDKYQSIKSVAGRNGDGTLWILSLDDAIRHMKNATYKFNVSVNGKTVWVELAKSAAGNLYLRTEADDTYSDNLLNLPEIPTQ